MVTTALIAARKPTTCEGSSFDVAMLDALGEWMSQPVYYSVYGRQPARRTGARHASIAPYGPYAVAGGGQVFIGLQNDREWKVLCDQLLGRPDLVADHRFATNHDRVAHDGELTPIIEAALQGVPLMSLRRSSTRPASQCPAAHTRGVRRAPATPRARQVARGALAGRPDPGPAAAGQHARP